MAQGKRDRLSTEQRTDMWRRWKAGESLHEIGRAFDKGHGFIRFLLTQRGSIGSFGVQGLNCENETEDCCDPCVLASQRCPSGKRT